MGGEIQDVRPATVDVDGLKYHPPRLDREIKRGHIAGIVALHLLLAREWGGNDGISCHGIVVAGQIPRTGDVLRREDNNAHDGMVWPFFSHLEVLSQHNIQTGPDDDVRRIQLEENLLQLLHVCCQNKADGCSKRKIKR